MASEGSGWPPSALDIMTELSPPQNSALVEENAATAKTLEEQSQGMDERVSFFRLDAGEPSHAAPAVPQRHAMAAPQRTPAAAKRAVAGRR